MLKDPNTPVFEEKWPSMRPTILKLLRQEAVTRAEWHDLFWLVHSVCLWDDKVGSSSSLHLYMITFLYAQKIYGHNRMSYTLPTFKKINNMKLGS